MRVVLVRTVVVATAIVLAVLGSERFVATVAALAAAACLVVIAMLVRSAPADAATLGVRAPEVPEPDTLVPDVPVPDVAVPDVPARTAQGTVRRGPPEADPRALPVGSALDGSPIELDAATGIVVVGRGAMAVAVFTALAAELGRCAGDDDELRSVEPDGNGAADGVAIAVVIDGAGDRTGSVVLVPDLRSTPRQRSPTIDVTRYGCTVRRDPDDCGSVRVIPRLPLLGDPAQLP